MLKVDQILKTEAKQSFAPFALQKGETMFMSKNFKKFLPKIGTQLEGQKLGAQLQNPSKLEQQGFGMIERIQTPKKFKRVISPKISRRLIV